MGCLPKFCNSNVHLIPLKSGIQVGTTSGTTQVKGWAGTVALYSRLHPISLMQSPSLPSSSPCFPFFSLRGFLKLLKKKKLLHKQHYGNIRILNEKERIKNPHPSVALTHSVVFTGLCSLARQMNASFLPSWAPAQISFCICPFGLSLGRKLHSLLLHGRPVSF